METADAKQPERLFTPHSPLWRVNREMLVLLSGPRAVLLEIAHPLIAEGVAQHSRYRSQPLGRLRRTMRTMIQLSFGGRHAIQRATQHMRKAHARVRGSLGEGAGPLPAGTRYSAHDPELRHWVLATLTDSILLTYEQFIRPLSSAEKEAYYADTFIIAPYLGVAVHTMPPNYAAFQTYMTDMIASDVLTVSTSGQKIADALFGDNLFGAVSRRLSWAGIGMTPPHLREAFGFHWTDKDDRWLAWLAQTTRAYRRWAPDLLTVYPQALWGAWQWQQAEQQRRRSGQQRDFRAEGGSAAGRVSHRSDHL